MLETKVKCMRKQSTEASIRHISSPDITRSNFY
jgi:hypothetical protein